MLVLTIAADHRVIRGEKVFFTIIRENDRFIRENCLGKLENIAVVPLTVVFHVKNFKSRTMDNLRLTVAVIHYSFFERIRKTNLFFLPLTKEIVFHNIMTTVYVKISTSM